jgi:SAM-dependent methyltransferase
MEKVSLEVVENKISTFWKLLVELATSNQDADYANFVTKWPLSYYLSRLKKINFVGMDSVLDVGCGYGQWTLALSILNGRATGVDQHKNRIAVANKVIKSLWINNAIAIEADAVNLPFEDASFDGLFCYGVFMFLDREAALKEFNRVLKPGGKLYICTNSRGWWLKLACENVFKNKKLFLVALKAFLGKPKSLPNSTGISQVSILPSELWCDIQFAPEGGLELVKIKKLLPSVYEEKFLGFNQVIEFIAIKKNNTRDLNNIKNINFYIIDKLLDRINSFQSQPLSRVLDFYNFYDQSADLVNATNPYVIDYVREITAEIDREAALKYIYKLITNETKDLEENLISCVTFSQKAFYQHFALQPMVGHNAVLLDPIESLFFGACRCGNSARFLVDLLLVNGFNARLIAGSCHTSAEVELDGRWVLADTSLYPPGVIPKNKSGQILSLLDLKESSDQLDIWPSYLNYDSSHVERIYLDYPQTYQKIKNWLRFPIYPSVGYFGEGFSDLNGVVRRWVKGSPKSAWGNDANYGWGQLIELDGFEGVECSVAQRPEQVQHLSRIHNTLRWPNSATPYPMELVYLLKISLERRLAEYSKNLCFKDFVDAENLVKTHNNYYDLGTDFNGAKIYVTIYAQEKNRQESFVLPSKEFYV